MFDEFPAVPPTKKLTAILCLSIIWVGAAVLLAVSIYFGVYERQFVRVEKVERLCVMKPNRNRGLAFSKRPIVTGDCQKLARAYNKEGRRRWYDYREPEPHIFISFTYHSPADGLEHRGRLMRALDDVGRPANVGNQIGLYVSRWVADVYTDFWNPSWPVDPKTEMAFAKSKDNRLIGISF